MNMLVMIRLNRLLANICPHCGVNPLNIKVRNIILDAIFARNKKSNIIVNQYLVFTKIMLLTFVSEMYHTNCNKIKMLI